MIINVATLSFWPHRTATNGPPFVVIDHYSQVHTILCDLCNFVADKQGLNHYAKLSRAMRAPWVDRFLNNEIYCYPLSKKRCRRPLRSPPARRSEGIVTSGRQQRNASRVKQSLLCQFILCWWNMISIKQVSIKGGYGSENHPNRKSGKISVAYCWFLSCEKTFQILDCA